jgi:hypothetical protein
MQTNRERAAGTALIIGTLLLVTTMVLHPAGGSVARLIERSAWIIGTHAIALLALPLFLVGFWGLSSQLQESWLLSRVALSVMLVGLFAALCAAAVNGLALPLFVRRFADASPQTIEAIKPVIAYNMALNHAFDFVFIGATCIAMVLWSLAILRKGALPKWIGIYGLLAGSGLLIVLASGVVLVDLHGFRLFIFAVVLWFLFAGISLCRRPARVAAW